MNDGSCNNIGRGFYLSSCPNFLDNKAMVTQLPPSERQQQSNATINITDPEKGPDDKSPKFRVRIVRPRHVANAVLISLVISVIILLELGYIPGMKTGFYCKDPLLSFPYRGESINATTLLVSNLIVVPLLVLLLTDFCFKRCPWQMWINDIWFIYKDFLTGCGLVLVLTEIMKALVGEHRPHFFAVCRPDTAENCTAGQYIDNFDCTVTTYSLHFMADTSKSFPSGHSSLSVFVAVFCSYLLQTRLSSIAGQICRMTSILVCITWSLICSLTRISDKRHHWWDVAGGMLLGSACAVYAIYNIHRKIRQECIPRVAVSTTTLVDIKNKDAKSEMI